MWTRVHAIFIKARALKGALSDGLDDLLGDAWIFIGRAIVKMPRDLHQAAEII